MRYRVEEEARIRRRARIQRVVIAVLVALVGLAGCGTIPDADQAIHSPHLYRESPKFAGADGPLSTQRDQNIVARLEQRTGGDVDLLSRDLAFEQTITGSPLIVGNKVTLLENGPDTYRAMFNAIEGANDNINLETFTFADDPVGQKFADVLIAKQRSGVQVNVIFDNFGSLHTSNAFFQHLRDNGIRVLTFNPFSPLKRRFHLFSTNHRDHRKLMIIDGKTAFLGGINISDVYSSGSGSGSSGSSVSGSGEKVTDISKEGWRDTDVEIEGPAVAECQKLFLGTWERQGGRPLSHRNYYPPLEAEGHGIVRIIGSVPKEPSLIYVTLISAIHNAQSNVYITDAYFAPDQQMLKEMKAASRRGVDVRLLVPGTADELFIKHAARSHYEDLLEAGVKIYEWRGKMLHAKTATIDHVWSMVGSSNLDWWSITRNDEITATILGVRFGREMDQMYAGDISNSVAIDREQWKSRSILERIEEAFARVLQPML